MKSKPKIVLIGGGGHCNSVIDVIEAENKFLIAGIVDLPERNGEKVLNYSIFANDNDLNRLIKEYKYFFITTGHIKTPDLRINLFNKVTQLGGHLPVIISPNAYISKHSIINRGTIIMHKTIINAGSIIGANCIINNKALVEHDCIIGDHCHVSTNAVVNGGLVLGNNCFLGSNAVTKQYIKIVANTVIGSGTVITKSITEQGVYVGNPAKRIR